MKSPVSTFSADASATPLAVAGAAHGASGQTSPAVNTTLSASRFVRETAAATPTGARRSSSKEGILDAAEAVVIADGAAHLTLDAVAERAGVSKGGLLYHFPTKELLLEAMVDRHMQRFEAMRVQARETLPPGPGQALKAFILSAHSKCNEAEKSLGCGMLAALANSPRLLDPVRASHRRRVEWLAQDEAAGLPFERTAAISLAVDGICLLEMLQVSPYNAEERQHILDELLLLVDEAVAFSSRRASES